MADTESLLMSFPGPFREALAVHECIRKLGFSSSQVFMHRNPPPRHDIVVVLKHRGKQLATTVGIYDKDDWQEQWTKLVHLFNGNQIGESEFWDWYEKSWVNQHKIEFLTVMESKGISPPLGKS